MKRETLNFTGMFSHYTPINFEPYYLFTTEQKFLIKCIDCPEFIGLLSPYDLVNIQAEVEEKCKEGTKLTNVKWGVVNEQ
jgi:hypothetical protein